MNPPQISDTFRIVQDEGESNLLTKYQQFFTGRPTIEIAKSLLGKQLSYTDENGNLVGGLIVETEAYLGENDSACMHITVGERIIQNRYMVTREIFTFTKFGLITVSM